MRKKIILAGAVSSLFLVPVYASVVDKPEGWYLQGSYESFFRFHKDRFMKDFNSNILGLSLGYKKSFLRGEGYVSYTRISEHHCWNNHCHLFGKTNNFNYGAHGFLDWDNQTFISPYIGLGLESKNYKTAFVQTRGVMPIALVGARAYLTNNLALDVGYKTNLTTLKEGGAASIGLAWHF